VRGVGLYGLALPLLTTGALLANAVAIATLGSLYRAGGLRWAAVVCAIAASTSSRLKTSP
jgi:hypothetical protein